MVYHCRKSFKCITLLVRVRMPVIGPFDAGDDVPKNALRNVVKALLLTAQRRDEIARMSRKEIGEDVELVVSRCVPGC